MHYKRTPYKTDTCPRRHAINTPAVSELHSLWVASDGVFQLSDTERLSASAWEGLSVMRDALRYRREAEEKEARK